MNISKLPTICGVITAIINYIKFLGLQSLRNLLLTVAVSKNENKTQNKNN